MMRVEWSAMVPLGLVAAGFALAGCSGYESAYERAVYAFEPVYCYGTLAAVDCYRTPDPRADRRLVSYYGPSPRRVKAPAVAEVRLDAPPAAEPSEGAGSGRSALPRGPTNGEEGLAEPLPLSAEALRLGGEGPGDGR
jgi:hypothetical protein